MCTYSTTRKGECTLEKRYFSQKRLNYPTTNGGVQKRKLSRREREREREKEGETPLPVWEKWEELIIKAWDRERERERDHCPTTNSGVQKRKLRSEHVHVACTLFARSVPICVLGRRLSAKKNSASELGRKLIESALLVGIHALVVACDQRWGGGKKTKCMVHFHNTLAGGEGEDNVDFLAKKFSLSLSFFFVGSFKKKKYLLHTQKRRFFISSFLSSSSSPLLIVSMDRSM